MEADWEVEIGGQAPIIDACWEGFADLRRSPDLVEQLPEVREIPALANALAQLNSASSPVWTVKCDVWRPSDLDVDELNAQAGEGNCAIACYIDLLPRADQPWPSPEKVVDKCQAIVARLRTMPLRCCRADLIVRRAYVTPDGEELGITAYLTACGSTCNEARATLSSALHVFVQPVLHADHSANPASKLQ
jgi:hypothetical protein